MQFDRKPCAHLYVPLFRPFTRSVKPHTSTALCYAITDTFINWQRFWTSDLTGRAKSRCIGKISPICPQVTWVPSM